MVQDSGSLGHPDERSLRYAVGLDRFDKAPDREGDQVVNRNLEWRNVTNRNRLSNCTLSAAYLVTRPFQIRKM